MDYIALIQSLGVATIGAIPGLLAFLIQRRHAMSKARSTEAELARLKDTSIVSLVDPLQRQIAYLTGSLEACQVEMDAARTRESLMIRQLARLINNQVKDLESFRDKILDIDKNGNGAGK